mmetsp:Transcript_78685/g.130320  ORF Transcript_78685/g.130320 Transcript_78685/m.130320 type:complete len:117 (+) Transcript_78685:363-713(+)
MQGLGPATSGSARFRAAARVPPAGRTEATGARWWLPPGSAAGGNGAFLDGCAVERPGQEQKWDARAHRQEGASAETRRQADLQIGRPVNKWTTGWSIRHCWAGAAIGAWLGLTATI